MSEINNNENVEVVEEKKKFSFKNINRKEVWDKVTTGLLILLMASPILVLVYIFAWFLNV